MELKNIKLPLPAKNVFSPFPARTHSTVDILWDKPEDYSSLVHYDCIFDVYLDNALAGSTSKGNFKLTGLKPDSSYTVYIRTRRISDGLQSEKTEKFIVKTKPLGKNINVLDFGACGDGSVVTTSALQKAIDSSSENDIVVIPEGLYITGALFLKSDLNLYLSKGAILRGSHNINDYPPIRTRIEGQEIDNVYASIITAGELNLPVRLKNISIFGEGTIDAQGSVIAPLQTAARNRMTRSNVITIMDCDGLYLQGITIEDSPFWTIHPINCDNFVTEGIILHTETNPHTGERYNVGNCDGWDPDSCVNCYAYNIEFNTHDDCIAVKSGTHHPGINQRRPSKNIRITDCYLRSGGGLALGSEMPGGIENVFVQDCLLGNIDRGIQIKTRRGRGAYIRDVVMKDIHIVNGGEYAIKVYMRYYDDNLELPEKPFDDPTTPHFENMYFENIVCETAKAAIQFPGLPESPIKNCGFKNITISSVTGISGDYCDTISFDNVNLNIKQGNAMFFKKSRNITGNVQSNTPPEYKSTLISKFNITDNENAANWSVQNNFSKGIALYGDKLMNLVDDVPSELLACDWIRTAHDSRYVTNTNLASFSIDKKCLVFIGYADTIKEKPLWLIKDDWKKTDLFMKEYIIEWERTNYFTFYTKEFDIGETVILGPNSGTLSDQMYTIVLKPILSE